MRLLAAVLALSIAACAGAQVAQSYKPSAMQQKADASFSAIPIDTPLGEVKGALTRIDVDDCVGAGECDWRDSAGVRHYFSGDGPESLLLVVKSVRADEFHGRSIPALGIGLAREQNDVLANIGVFLPGADLDCDASQCSAVLDPGWLTIRFDAAGQLEEARFDGYHFT